MPFCKKTGKEFICKRKPWTKEFQGLVLEYKGIHAQVEVTINPVKSNDELARERGLRISKKGHVSRVGSGKTGCGSLVTNFAQLSSARQR